jgi:hypothetical protein
MSTSPQIAANRANSQLSTGPKTEEGKIASSKNSIRHMLTMVGETFCVPHWESQDSFDMVVTGIRDEHQPSTTTENILVEHMAQHFWLRKRAITFQDRCFDRETGLIDQKAFALYLRYEATHDRGFHKCLAELLKLRAEKQKSEIGFASHKRKQESHAIDLLIKEEEMGYHHTRTFAIECEIRRQDYLAGLPPSVVRDLGASNAA